MMFSSFNARKGAVAIGIMMTTLAVTLGGCGRAGDKAGDSSRITVGIPQDIDSLDPHNALAAGTREVLFNVFEGIVKPDENGDLIPAVASEVTISPDATTYAVTLREGVKFHDGSTVTVEDIKYSLDRVAGIGQVAAFSAVESVNIVDDTHLEIVLNAPNTDFLAQLTVAIIPAAVEDPASTPVGTGPYRYVSRSPQENIVMERFDDYWGEKAYIKDLVWKIETDNDAVVVELEAGAIDLYCRIGNEKVAQLSDHITIYEGTMNLVQALYLNNAVAPFDDVRVRQALCYATDRSAIIDFVSDGQGVPIGSSIYPAFSKYFTPELVDLYDHNIEKAKELLAEAGYPDGFSFTIHVASNYGQHIETAEVLVEQLKEIGVTARIEQIEWNSWLSDVYSQRNYEATVVGVDASVLSPTALLSRFVSDAGNNFVNFRSDAYDAAYAAAMAATDDAEKTAYFKECERILAEEAANVYIQDLPEYVALNNRFTGYTFYPLYVQNIATIRPAE